MHVLVPMLRPQDTLERLCYEAVTLSARHRRSPVGGNFTGRLYHRKKRDGQVMCKLSKCIKVSELQKRSYTEYLDT